MKQAARSRTSFEAFLAELDAALGPRESWSTHRVALSTYRAPPASEVNAWIAKGRAAGAAATIYVDGGGDQSLTVTAGRASRLAALFGYSWYLATPIVKVLDALDDDAGLTFRSIADDATSFEIALDRVPAHVDEHAEALSEIFSRASARGIATALRTKAWRVR